MAESEYWDGPAGLTKREWFAGLVMQGFAAHAPDGLSLDTIAYTAVTVADALLKALAE